ncbi:MAG TPA: ATP-dependent RecD-like DNA helicase, partial [Deltaproteobacteria bacterium]|nr:ATP-dependent RecD-like DNA helicase [Deltaproteobacteria bacterium]
MPLVHFAPVTSEPVSADLPLFAPTTGPPDSDSIEGVLAHVVFRNPETHFVIARLELDEARGNVTIKGLLPGVGSGERVRVQGRWVDDPRYGRQFDIESFLPLVPDTEEGLERFLRGGRVEGIGPVYAKRLVAFFGKGTLEVLDNSPERLREVPGIGPSRAARIAKSWSQQRGERDAIIFLSGLGLAAGLATRVFRRYREHTVRRVRENPYRMATDITGIGFLTADAVAARLGIEKSSPHRLRAGLLHSLSTATSHGHCFLPASRLMEHAAALLRLEELPEGPPDLQGPLDDLVSERTLVRERVGSEERLW